MMDFQQLGETVLRTAVIYVAITIMMRASGKRRAAQLSAPDFILMLLVSEVLQNGMVGKDDSVAGGLAAAATLLGVDALATKIALRSERAAKVMEGEPALLVRDGQVLEQRLSAEGLRREELLQAIRKCGLENESQVKLAILEINGEISIIPRESGNAS